MKVELIYNTTEVRRELVQHAWGQRWQQVKHVVEVSKSWTRKHTFIHRTSYSQELWQFGEETVINGERTWMIDIREKQLQPAMDGRIVTIVAEDGPVHFKSDLTDVFTGEVVWSDLEDAYVNEQYAVHVGWDGEDGVCSQRWARDNDYQNCGSYGWLIDPYDHDLVFTEDTENWMYVDDAVWCDYNECWYEDPDNQRYNTSDSVDHINEYHCSPQPDNLTGESTISFGYEIEKVYFNTDEHGRADECGDYVGEFEMFKGFETDSSCGVEAITHILPGDSYHIGLVEGWIDDAAVIFNSPANERCGGHVTISAGGYNGTQLLTKLRPYMGLVYAMFSDRLSNDFCCRDMKLIGDVRHKYRVMNVMDNRIEIRLPDAVLSAEEFKLRHRLFVTIVEYALEDKGYLNLLKDTASLLAKWEIERGMGHSEVDEHIEQMVTKAMDFRAWLLRNEKSDRINRYVGDVTDTRTSVGGGGSNEVARPNAYVDLWEACRVAASIAEVAYEDLRAYIVGTNQRDRLVNLHDNDRNRQVSLLAEVVRDSRRVDDIIVGDNTYRVTIVGRDVRDIEIHRIQSLVERYVSRPCQWNQWDAARVDDDTIVTYSIAPLPEMVTETLD